MAQSYVTDAGTLIIPSAVASWKVATDNSGLSTAGVIMLVGEAEAGPSFDLEDDLGANAFGPDQVAAVVAKYKAGPLVDAFRAAVAAANDPNITGSPSRLILVKTNKGARAKAALKLHDGSEYALLADQSLGKLGNLIWFEVKNKQAEVAASTGAFTWIPNVDAVNAELRVNGLLGSLALSANQSPAQFVAAVNAVSADLASGGALRSVIPSVAGNIALAKTGNQITITYTGTWATVPSVGDTLVIPSTSVLGDTETANVGAYVVTAATSNTVTAVKLSDAGAAGAVAGTVTAPVVVASVAVAATTDFSVFAPVTLAVPGNPLPGAGKSLEVAQLATGADLIERCLFALGTVAVAWVSKSTGSKLLVSAAEHIAQINVNRQMDGIQEELIAGGEIALKIGYTGTSAQAVVADDKITITVAGGAGESIGELNLKDFPTLADLATFINSKLGYKCSVGNAILGQLSPVALDDGTFGFSTSFGEMTGRIKIDAFKLFKKLSEESVLVRQQNAAGAVVQAAAGLPAPQSATYLAGGTKGATLKADFVAAIDALEKVRGNFLVPLFSRDASLDKADGLTDSASDYEIDAINGYVRTHVLKMSTLKRRRNRQAFLSKKDTFANQKEAASNTAAFRCAMTFQDVKNVAGDGAIKQFAPWMAAVIAAGMQAAGFYRAIVGKFANINGAIHALKQFNDQDDTLLEDALIAGLLPLRRDEAGGWKWVSDQTTYGKDSNFVFNSIQATYVADVIAMTTAQRMEKAFVGQSVADVSAPLALAFLEAVMGDFLRLKLIAPSEDAPKGYKNAVIRISGTSMVVSLEIKLAGCIYFVPISFLVSQVSQSAQG